MIIYLLRHGQTTGDIEHRYGGDYDDHLTELGLQQAAILAEQITEKGIEKLFSSPRIRAQETAAAVAGKLGLAVVTLDDFRERNSYGILTGTTKEKALDTHPDQVEILKDIYKAVEGAEEYLPFQERVTKVLDKMSHEPADKVAVITHGGPIKLIFRDILKLGEIDVADCAFAAIEANDQHYKLLETVGITMNNL